MVNKIVSTISMMTLVVASMYSQIDIGIFNPANDNKFEVRIKPQITYSGANYGQVAFTVRWLSSYGVTLQNFNSPNPGITFVSNGTSGTANGFNYQVFIGNSLTISTLTMNQEYLIFTFEHSNNGTGTGVFEIVNDTWTATNNGNHYEEYNSINVTGLIYASSASSPLPLDLTKIKALTTLTTIPILWETANEHNFNGFEVQRSQDGAEFLKIAWISGKGGQAGASYEYEDKDVRPGITYYYRLKMVDNDGSFQYSPVVSARLDGRGGDLKLYPNPTSGQVTLDWYAPAAETFLMNVFSETGGLILSREFEAPEGANQLQLDLQDLPPGLYLVRGTSARETFTGKILRSR